ncbi:hypothetical protein V2S66_19630 [Streptomyces sp. V4-01]|uniref:Uncharacterized protein n=1 Tax=Actinacidiphila polyblastidii TaxID=3110430 RepID=A0ABU7PEE0_9ACTN|nr:hypothetical protein [Streptomyces sp. V4-01]
MPSHQFCIYELRIRQLNKKDAFRDVASFTPSRADLLADLENFLENQMGTKGVSLDKGEHYIRLSRSSTKNRIIWPTVESGRFGSTGKVVDKDTGDDTYSIKDSDAPTYPMRQAFIVPTAGDRALWATEVVGHNSAITSLWNSFYDWFREKYDSERLTLERSPLQDTDAWKAFIDESELQEIKFVAHVSDSDGSVGVRAQEFISKSGRGTRLPKWWLGGALKKELPASTVFSISGIPEADEVHLEIERDGRSRRIVVGRDFPRFMYQLEDAGGVRPSDTVFREAVLSEAGASLDLMGVTRDTWQR